MEKNKKIHFETNEESLNPDISYIEKYNNSPTLSIKKKFNEKLWISPIKAKRKGENFIDDNLKIMDKTDLSISNRNYNHCFNSPKKEKTNSVNESKLNAIYEYYSQLEGKNLNRKLKISDFMKILTDSNHLNDKLPRSRVEIIINTEINKNKFIDFKVFTKILLKCAECRYENEIKLDNSKKVKFIQDFINKILSLYEKIYEKKDEENGKIELFLNQTTSNQNITLINNTQFELEQTLQDLLRFCSPSLFEMYKLYFQVECSSSIEEQYIIENSKKSWVNFMKTFDLCPFFVSMNSILKIFMSEINFEIVNIDLYYSLTTKIENVNNSNRYEFGQYFSFFKFLRSLIRVSDISFMYDELKNKSKSSIYVKFCNLLEKIEISDSFNQMRRSFKTQNNKFSRLLPNEVSNMMNSRFKLNEDSHLDKTCLNEISRNEPFEYANYILEKYKDDLIHLFRKYCVIDNSNTQSYMKYSNILKIYKDSGLIKNTYSDSKELGIKVNEFDKVFYRTVWSNDTFNSKEEKRKDPKFAMINFEMFIHSIEAFAKVLSNDIINLREVIEELINNYLIPLRNMYTSNNFEEKYLLDEENDDVEITRLKEIMKKMYSPIFHYYTEKSNMNLDMFMKFSVDFEVCPGILTKNKIISIFQKLFENNSKDNSSQGLNTKTQINEDQFILILVKIGLESKFADPQPTKIFKILSLLDKIYFSDGCKKILLKVGTTRLKGNNLDLITELRKNYPDFFKQKVKKEEDLFDFIKND